MATISNIPRPGYVWDTTDNCWYPIGVGGHNHPEYVATVSAYSAPILGSTSITSGSTITTINGLVKIASAAHVSLDANGYEQDTNLMHIMDAW